MSRLQRQKVKVKVARLQGRGQTCKVRQSEGQIQDETVGRPWEQKKTGNQLMWADIDNKQQKQETNSCGLILTINSKNRKPTHVG